MAMNGDYYEWFCDWCDSRNFTRVYKAAEGPLSCCACHRKTGYLTNCYSHKGDRTHDSSSKKVSTVLLNW